MDEVLDRIGARGGGRVTFNAASTTFGQNVIDVDASVLAVAPGDDGTDGEHGRERLAGETLVAPELVDLNVVSVLPRHVAEK
jgi:hypothetical protein